MEDVNLSIISLFAVVIARIFSTGQDNSDMGEFTFERKLSLSPPVVGNNGVLHCSHTLTCSMKLLRVVTKTYRGDMTNVGESVGVTGVMSTTDTADNTEREVGYFNMIDATDERVGDDKKAP